jgi:hypothetical protein
MPVFRLCFVPFLEINSPPTLGGPHPMVRARPRAREPTHKNAAVAWWTRLRSRAGLTQVPCSPDDLHAAVFPCQTACLTAGKFTAQLGNGRLASQFAETRSVNGCPMTKEKSKTGSCGPVLRIMALYCSCLCFLWLFVSFAVHSFGCLSNDCFLNP